MWNVSNRTNNIGWNVVCEEKFQFHIIEVFPSYSISRAFLILRFLAILLEIDSNAIDSNTLMWEAIDVLSKQGK